MPKFYGQNKKRRDPRYFLNEGKTPDEMIELYKSSGQRWNMAQNDFLNMAKGGDADGVRPELYSEWTDDMFQQVVDAVEGDKKSLAPPWEDPMGRAQELAQQGMAANDFSGLSEEELKAQIAALQDELSKKLHAGLAYPAVADENPLSGLADFDPTDVEEK